MRTRKDVILGIEFTPQHIRVVELQGRGANVQVLHAGVATMPDGAFVGDRIVEPEAVGIALRRVLESARVTTRDAIFGLASGSVVTQVMNVPFVPDHELQAVLEGELEHYKIMRHGESAFDYLRLNAIGTPGDAQAAGESPMLLMAAERPAVASYQRVAELADINLVSLEPTLLGMYRVGWMLTREQTGAMCLSVDRVRSELAFIEAGNIRLYRSIDVGSQSLLPTLFPGSAPQGGAGRSRASILGEDEDADTGMPGLNSGMPGPAINKSAASALALEIRRSIEYYRRENPASDEGEIFVVSDLPEMEALQEWLLQELGREVRLAHPGLIRGLTNANVLQTSIMGRSGIEASELALTPALGLALGGLPDAPPGVPRFNLTATHRQNALADAARRALTLSLAAAAAVLLLGAVIAGLIAVRAGATQREVDTLQAEYNEKQRQQEMILSEWQTQQTQLQALQRKGFPFPRLLDAVTDVVPSQVGLTEVALNADGRMTVAGNAIDDRAVQQSLDGMRTVNWFVFPTLDSQERKQDRIGVPPRVEFKISTQLAGAAPPTAPKPGGLP